jgi:ribonuclease HI/exonuclease III
MRDRRIGILALQETHLDEKELTKLRETYGRRLVIINSALQDEREATGSAGVAFVLNKAVIETESHSLQVVIPGRAVLLTVKWRDEQEIRVLNVYGHNQTIDQREQWVTIQRFWRENDVPKPDFVVGDFNIVEDKLDRAPMNEVYENPATLEAFTNMRECLGVEDAWRRTFPDSRMFTYVSARHHMSRLDRIYSNPEHNACMFEWFSGRTTIRTDHDMVAAKFAPTDSPEMGMGRWTWPAAMLTNKTLMKYVEERAWQFQMEVKEWEDEEESERTKSADSILKDFKADIKSKAQEIARVAIPKMNNKIKSLTKAIKELGQRPDLDGNTLVREEMSRMKRQVDDLMAKKEGRSADTEKANWDAKGETITPYWININKEKKPRDAIRRFQIPGTNPPIYETDTTRMSEIARKHYNGVQYPKEDLESTVEEREECIKEALGAIPDSQKLREDRATELASPINACDVKAAIKVSKGRKATGLDGIPYEIWKALDRSTYTKTVGAEEKKLDISAALASVFNAITKLGVDSEAGFTDGWLCPLYKKKDRTIPANYRPITLLNTDYKLFTKILAMRLANVVRDLVHPDQAGFIPGRSIFDHVRLSQAMISYAEAEEVDGVIVALDQEKAYDRVRHDYMWETLETYGLPKAFTDAVKALYDQPKTLVIVNGVMSDPFTVTRGVRQGDPLSCLLFDLAIEPLACLLRSSTEIAGYSVPGLDHNLIVNMFADDTIVYLSKDDKYSDLLKVLRKWCTAAGAKFNEDKTEIVPIGSPHHRKRIVDSRKLSEDEEALEGGVRVAPDGHAIRSLGAWIGNGVNDATPWTPVLDSIQTSLQRWDRGHPTIRGKRLIVQMVAGGKSQYLTRVQGMPKEVTKRLVKMISEFMKSSTKIALETLYQPIERGGIGLLDVESRNQAIEAMWMRDFMKFGDDRPIWAFLYDRELERADANPKDLYPKSNMFLQSWNAVTQGARANLIPTALRRMIKAAQAMEVNLEAIRIETEIQHMMPAWLHPAVPKRTYHSRRDECLVTVHGVTTVWDLTVAARRLQRSGSAIQNQHKPNSRCTCRDCQRDRGNECDDPHRCAMAADKILSKIYPRLNPRQLHRQDDLSLTPVRLEKNRQSLANMEGTVLFDPSTTVKDSLDECFRVFVGPSNLEAEPACRVSRPARGLNLADERVTVTIESTCHNEGRPDAECVGGAWCEEDETLSIHVRARNQNSTRLSAELTVLITALQRMDTARPITIRSSNRLTIEGPTRHLKKWEDRGWVGVPDRELWKALVYELRRKSAQVGFEWIRNRKADERAGKAKRLAEAGIDDPNNERVPTAVPTNWEVRGAKLSGLKQKTAYLHLIEKRVRAPTKTRVRNMSRALAALSESEQLVSRNEANVWSDMWHKSVRKPIAQFFYALMNGTQKVGRFWLNIEGWEDYAKCKLCGADIEDMEHILIKCKSAHRRITWELCRKTWPEKNETWPAITMGTVLGCNSITLKPDVPTEQEPEPRDDEKARGRSQLMRETIREAAHLVWGMRCERTVGKREAEHTAAEIERRWNDKIVDRFKSDRALVLRAGKAPSKVKALKAKWDAVVDMTRALDKIQEPLNLLGFLVGTERPPPLREAEPEPHTTGLLDPE